MNMNRLAPRLTLATLLLLCVPTSAQQVAGMLKSAKLLSPEVGWAATSSRIFWTANTGKEWKDITPKTATPEDIASVFFLDTSRGWLLLSVWDKQLARPRFDLASTNDAGQAWTVIPLKLPLDQTKNPLSPGGCLDFLDQTHGYLDLDMESGVNFRIGMLLATADGGETWR